MANPEWTSLTDTAADVAVPAKTAADESTLLDVFNDGPDTAYVRLDGTDAVAAVDNNVAIPAGGSVVIPYQAGDVSGICKSGKTAALSVWGRRRSDVPGS